MTKKTKSLKNKSLGEDLAVINPIQSLTASANAMALIHDLLLNGSFKGSDCQKIANAIALVTSFHESFEKQIAELKDNETK